MRFAVETWDPAYGASEEGDLDRSSETVDAAVEVDPGAWRAITPDPDGRADSVAFVDGVRRIDTRVWVDEGDIVRPGLCATVAAGLVRCTPAAATVDAVLVARGLHTAAEGATDIDVGHCGVYELHPVGGDDEATLYTGVHEHMTSLEKRISADVDGGELIVFDGPLRGRDTAAGVGYVKTHHRTYLERREQGVVVRLDDGQRSPLFAIGGSFPRWSWYLRLPGPRSHPMSGVVRLELPGHGSVDDAACRADTVSATLPRFASEPHKQSRAPQNLYPIAGLEHELGRRLGDTHLLANALRRAAAAVAPGQTR